MIGIDTFGKAVLASVGAVALVALAGCDDSNGAGTRDQIKIVGSSTVFPFAKAVSEQFVAKNAGMKSPIVESNGTGAGMKIFCGGKGASFPDIVDASRRMKPGEFDLCTANGVTRIGEIQIGLDGMAFAENKKGPALKLTTLALYRALAAKPFGLPQTAKTWKDVDPTLPAIAIKIYGPPASSGTRDALAELIMTRGCDTSADMRKLGEDQPKQHTEICTTIREDGAFVEAGENDSLIVQKLGGDPNAVGIFGYSFLAANADKLNGNAINGVVPTYESIANFTYPGARPLYIYVKMAHLTAIKGLKEFVSEFGSAWGQDGYLKRSGMVIAPADVLTKSAAQVKDMKPLVATDLK